jgi:Amt family ammonium transporter
MESANILWMLMCACLILLMTIGIAFYYTGQTRVKSALNMVMLTITSLVVTLIVWILWGWSIAQSGSDVIGLFGDPAHGFLLRDVVTGNPAAAGAKGGAYTAITAKGSAVPQLTVALVGGLVAVIAVDLITGALAGRIKVSTWMVFVVLWITLVFAPIAHMVWSGSGLLSEQGALSHLLGTHIHDLAGSSAVWLVAGVSALAIVLIIGQRRNFHVVPLKPHNMVMVLIGGLIMWVGFLGFVGGRQTSASPVAAYSLTSALLAPAASCLGWMIVDKIRTHHFTALGAVSGLVSGMAMISAGADSIGPLWVLIAGLFTGVICSFCASLKYRFGYDDALDVVPICGIPGLLGVLFDGLFAQSGGLLTGGGFALFGADILACLIIIFWSGVWTAAIAFGLEKTMGWRVSDRDEDLGIDIVDQGERAYDLDNYTNSVYQGAQR